MIGRDRRGPRRQAHRHHRIDRLRRHRAGRAAAARGARLRAGPARAAGQALDGGPAGAAGDPQERRLRPPARRARQGRLRRDGRRGGCTAIAGDVGTDGLGLDDADRATLASLRHRHPLGGHRRLRLARSTAPSRSTCSGPTRIADHAATSSASRPTSSPCRRATSPATAAAPAPEELGRRGPVRPRPRLAGRGRRGPPAARRRRGREPHARDARRASARRPATSSARPARPPWPPRPSSCRERWVTDRLVEAGRARAASVGWPDAYAYTKALGEQALIEIQGRRAGLDRAAVDHRVGARRAPAGLDPRLPHGRAGHHLLRPRPAEGVPRRARGHGRRHPGRPRRRRHHRRRRRSGPSGAPTIAQVASGSVNPLQVPDAGRQRARRGSPSTRCTTPRASRSSCPSGASPAAAGCRASSTGPRRCSTADREGAAVAAAARASRPSWSARLEEQARRGRAGPRVRRALRRSTPSARRSTGRPPAGALGRARRRPTGPRFGFDPRVIDWPRYITRDPPAVGRRARPGQDHAGQEPHRAARDRLRRQVLSPDRHLAAFDLENTLIASTSWRATRGWPPAGSTATSGCASCCARWPRRPACWPSTARTAATSCASSTAATRTRRSTQLDEDAAELFSQLILTKSFPAAIRRVREHRALGHRTVLITGALDFVVEPLRPLFDEIIAAEMSVTRRRHLHRRADRRCRRPARPGPRSWPTTAPPKGLTLARVVAYADSTATCRCSRRSASPWPSTPRPGWPRSPASGAGWSSTGRRRRAARGRSLPIGAAPPRASGGLANPLVAAEGGR